MTVTCPDGHASESTDYCDVCGRRIAPAPAPEVPADTGDEELATSSSAPREPCPVCRLPRTGDDRFCEQCGHDFTSPAPPAAGWDAVAAADRALFERQSSEGVEFPAHYEERHFTLTEPRLRIGRSRPGGPVPEIDLAGTPCDPGISRMHAELERQHDGSYTLRDLGSTNGTTLNGSATELGTDTAVPVGDGDRIHLGAWTTITVRRR